RYLTGTLDLHIELEERLAKFFNSEAVLLFSTGYLSAQGIIPTLVQRGDYVISDKDNHACIVAGTMMTKGLMGELVRYKHNDMDDLERQISKIPDSAGKLIVTDGVFSTGGEIVNLPRLYEIAKKYGASVMVDDAHAVGVIGKGGRGTASEFDLEKEIDLTMGTFSKTFASLGGFVAGSERVINYLKHFSSALIFSASPTPASVASALAALEILEAEPERVNKLVDNANYMRKNLTEKGFNIIQGRTAIVPVIIGDDERSFMMWKYLYDHGVFVNVFISPGVPQGRQMMRTSYMATHEKEHLDEIINVFEKAGKAIGII
ncbi:MAG: aminotransferase class I/II-fold pyridoxal phosphate-dependent enzyme, partial [Ignavibacteriaceae bacterium]|nr:aminotransferase class I/II-fold pyridoxal phosphate-dependent enzyme [Ignavibacteriaceae bacterium]